MALSRRLAVASTAGCGWLIFSLARRLALAEPSRGNTKFPTVWRRADDFIAWYLGIPIPAVVRERGFGGHRTWDEGRRQEQKLPRIIEWLRNPMVEVRGFVHKQQVSEWLALAQGKRYRTMTAKNKTFVWAPDDDPICLYSSGVGAPETHARLNDSRRSRRGGGP
ncbi:hypothetical protein R3P38DRAFT_2776437 [Favolaschia claudopus]|uniref:Uncharacterized protein n=1 Tax=Favolaschia claudopus TaxID=2862362 RepID=A0AAW0BQD4_9AGAR